MYVAAKKHYSLSSRHTLSGALLDQIHIRHIRRPYIRHICELISQRCEHLMCQQFTHIAHTHIHHTYHYAHCPHFVPCAVVCMCKLVAIIQLPYHHRALSVDMACCCVEGSCGAGADAMFPHFRASLGYIEKCLMYIMGCSHCLQGIPFVVVVGFARRRKVREHTFVLPFAPTHTHTNRVWCGSE